MSLVQIVAILGSIPLFSLRTFLPAFLTALLLAYPEYFPGMDKIPPVPEEAFITRDWVLILLGILSVLEIIGDKSTEIRNLVKNVETYLKPAFFLAIHLSLLDEASTQVLREMQWAAFEPLWIFLGLGTLAVHWLAGMRKKFISFLEGIDEDDNIYISRITSWLEDSLVLFGFLLLVWTGLLMVVLYAAGITVFVYLQKRYSRKIEQQKLQCPHCKEWNLPYAVKCFNCKTSLPRVYSIGVFGQKRKKIADDIHKHRLKLIAHRKCSICGQKLNKNKVYQNCDRCGNPSFEAPTVPDFLKFQDRMFYKITGLSFLLGFIPIVGFVVSAVIANIFLLSPYRRYLPRGSSFFTKLFIKLTTFLLFLLGIALGFIAAPAYIILKYFIWRKKFISKSTRQKI